MWGDGGGGPRSRRQRAGPPVSTRRDNKALLRRAARVAVIGYPNVGKSALINRLLGRKLAKSEDKPGVTRSLQWMRLGKHSGDARTLAEVAEPARAFAANLPLGDTPAPTAMPAQPQQSSTLPPSTAPSTILNRRCF